MDDSLGGLQLMRHLHRFGIFGRVEPDQLMRFERKLEPVFDSGLFKDMHEMNLHCPDRDRKSVGDLLVLHATADQRHNFVLTRSESRKIPPIQESYDLI